MALNYDELLAARESGLGFRYDDTECMLYAQSIGFGRDPLDLKELSYVYEQGPTLQTVPTLATALVPDMFPPDLGWDYGQLLHAEQRLRLYRPLPPAAELSIDKRVAEIYDNGPRRGAIFVLQAEARLAHDETVLFELGATVLARGDGGFGGQPGSGPRPHRVPRREPDFSADSPTRVDQALLFRLNGDRNPLHADPAVALQAGFDVPILHGLCTYGIACRAILRTICDYDHTLIDSFDARFSAPVIPGDTVTTDMWQDGNVISFQCSVRERASIVLRNGRCTLVS
jgi:acyl dehydratase